MRGLAVDPLRGEGRGRRSWLRQRGLDDFDLAVLAALALLSLTLLAAILWHAAPDRIWTGTDGISPADQMQYLAWIREAAESVLISNQYRLEPTASSFVHPGVLLSAIVVRLGAAPWIAYLLWKPVAVLTLFLAVHRYVWALASGPVARRCALVLALFFIAPAGSILRTDQDTESVLAFTQNDMWPGFWLWGYPFTAIAVAALAAGLIAYGRDRAAGAVRPWAPLLGLFCAWLQPWQGATLLAVVVGSEVVLLRAERQRSASGELRRRLKVLLPTAVATSVPLLYYAILNRADPSWAVAAEAGNFVDWPLWTVAVSIAPLALPAALAYRRRPLTFSEASVRLWPVVAIAIYGFISATEIGTFAPHALQGISIPLAILGVEGARQALPGGLRSDTRVALATGAVFLLTVPLTIQIVRDSVDKLDRRSVHFVTRGERDALDYLEQSEVSGGVLATPLLGHLVPVETGRRTWAGSFSWTPDYYLRTALASALFDGRLGGSRERSLIRGTGARFLLSDCRAQADLSERLGALLASVHRFGCATVYETRVAD